MITFPTLDAWLAHLETAHPVGIDMGLTRIGKVKEALVSMKRAAERMMEERAQEVDATIMEHLGDVYFQLQEIEKAEDAWSQALKAGEQAVPPDKRVSELRKKLDSLKNLGPTPKPSSNKTP